MQNGRVKVHLLQQWPLLTLSLATLTGLALGSELPTTAGSLLLGLIAIVTIFGLGLTLARTTDWLIAPFLLLAVLVAAGSTLMRGAFQPLVSAETVIESGVVTVVSAPAEETRTTRAYVDLADGGRLRAQWPTSQPVRYGNQLRVSGTIHPPQDSDDFSETRFLRAHGAIGTLSATSVEVLSTWGGNRTLRALHALRLTLLARLERVLEVPASTVVAGIVFGEQGALAPALVEAFRQTGTTHLLVASGSNLIILAAILAHLAHPLGRRRRVVITLVVLGTFVVLAGVESSIVRAACFAGLGALSELSGRRVHWPTLIATVAAVMTLLNPWIILGDIGFQLSFAAVLGLALFEPVLAAHLPGAFFKEFLAPTLAAHLAALPLLVYHFGQASLVAPFANLIAVPFALPLMAGGLTTTLLPWLRIIAWATEGAATILLTIVTRLSELPWASLALPANQFVWTAASLGLVVIALILRARWQRLDRSQVAHA